MTTYINQSQQQKQPEYRPGSALNEHLDPIISSNQKNYIICSPKNSESVNIPNDSEKNQTIFNPEEVNPSSLNPPFDELSEENLPFNAIQRIHLPAISYPIISANTEQHFEESATYQNENPECSANKLNQAITYSEPIASYFNQPIISSHNEQYLEELPQYPDKNHWSSTNKVSQVMPDPPVFPSYLNNPPANPPVTRINYQNQQESRLRGFLDNSSMITVNNDRRSFIIKVYALLLFQLMITAIFVSIVCGIKDLREEIKKFWLIAAICCGMTCIIMIAIFYFKKFVTHYPYNHIALFLYTLFETYIVAFICTFYDPIIIICAAVCTLVIVFALTIYAWKTKRDFTQGRGALIVTLVLFCIFGLTMVWLHSNFLYTIYCFVVVLLFGYFIVFDTQLIAGGRHRELTYDDYTVAALLLYIDIVIVFLYILAYLDRKHRHRINNGILDLIGL